MLPAEDVVVINECLSIMFAVETEYHCEAAARSVGGLPHGIDRMIIIVVMVKQLIARFIVDQYCWTQTSLWSRDKISWQTPFMGDDRMIKISVTFIKIELFLFQTNVVF